MKKNLSVILPVVVIVLVLVAAWIGYDLLKDKIDLSEERFASTSQQPQREAAPELPPDASGSEASKIELSAAPDFTVYDKDGGEVKLSDFAGKTVVLNFWASWCGFCVEEMPEFQEAYDEYGGDIVFMMVNVTDGSRETQADAESFIDQKGYTMPVYFDTSLEAAAAYDASGLPMTVIVNKAGEMAGYAKGAIDGDTLRGAIDKLGE